MHSEPINCVATLVGKVLPVFHPNASFVKEGCYVLNTGGCRIVVSPDGSCRTMHDNTLNETVCGLEIKCPYPGKICTTPVYYKLPVYYVFQILCEMDVLKTDKLLFMCYSLESTSVFEAFICLMRIFGRRFRTCTGQVVTTHQDFILQSVLSEKP